jgi:hypothetical protein
MGNSQQAKKLTPKQMGCIVVVVLWILLSIIIGKSCFSGKSSSKTTKIISGSSVIIQSSSGDPVVLANTKEAYKEMHKYSIANDQTGLSGMVLSGNAFIVDSGTKALVIDRGIYEFEVRIQSGDRFGSSGWVASDLIKLSE